MDKKIAIRVVTKMGKIVNRYVDSINDYLDGTGAMYSIAVAGKTVYRVNNRTADGIIWIRA